jgi:mannose-6-phosphate isomerase-like protein (cupin superfamily)
MRPLEDLRLRIGATNWPEKETVDDESQGVQLATIQALAHYWETAYDWRKCEARLKALPHFVAKIDGLDIHFIHVRSEHQDALPLGASLYQLDPGDRVWPYHTHHSNEEWVLVVKGQPTLRTPDGEQQLREGDVACFPVAPPERTR